MYVIVCEVTYEMYSFSLFIAVVKLVLHSFSFKMQLLNTFYPRESCLSISNLSNGIFSIHFVFILPFSLNGALFALNESY